MTRFEEKQNFCEDKEEALVWISDNFREFEANLEQKVKLYNILYEIFLDILVVSCSG